MKEGISRNPRRGNRLQIVALAAIPLLLLALSVALNPGSGFEGSDEIGAKAIVDGHPGTTPWVSPLWSPPEGSEELLFGLQAALGLGVIGYYFHRRGR